MMHCFNLTVFEQFSKYFVAICPVRHISIIGRFIPSDFCMSNNMGCGVGDEGTYPVAEYPASVIDSLKVFIINPLGVAELMYDVAIERGNCYPIC
jgi:hypothetical protein